MGSAPAGSCCGHQLPALQRRRAGTSSLGSYRAQGGTSCWLHAPRARARSRSTAPGSWGPAPAARSSAGAGRVGGRAGQRAEGVGEQQARCRGEAAGCGRAQRPRTARRPGPVHPVLRPTRPPTWLLLLSNTPSPLLRAAGGSGGCGRSAGVCVQQLALALATAPLHPLCLACAKAALRTSACFSASRLKPAYPPTLPCQPARPPPTRTQNSARTRPRAPQTGCGRSRRLPGGGGGEGGGGRGVRLGRRVGEAGSKLPQPHASSRRRQQARPWQQPPHPPPSARRAAAAPSARLMRPSCVRSMRSPSGAPTSQQLYLACSCRRLAWLQ